MLLVGLEGGVLYLDDIVVGKDSEMKENQRKKTWVDEEGGKKSKQQKLDIDLHKERQEKITKHKKSMDWLEQILES